MEIISFGHDASQKSFKSNLLNINIRLESKDQKGSQSVAKAKHLEVTTLLSKFKSYHT